MRRGRDAAWSSTLPIRAFICKFVRANRVQERRLDGYPAFTRKPMTDREYTHTQHCVHAQTIVAAAAFLPRNRHPDRDDQHCRCVQQRQAHGGGPTVEAV